MSILTCSQVDNADTSRRTSGELVADAATSLVEIETEIEDIPEVRNSIQLAFPTFISNASGV